MLGHRRAVDRVVGGHDAPGVGVGDDGLERREVQLAQGTGRDDVVHAATGLGVVGDGARGRPRGLAFLRHLVETARHNDSQAGIVRPYTVLSAESVTAGHPTQPYFRDRHHGLRTVIVEALRSPRIRRGDHQLRRPDHGLGIIAVMDGLRVQWLLAPETTDMATATETAIITLVGAKLPPAQNPPISRLSGAVDLRFLSGGCGLDGLSAGVADTGPGRE